MSNLWEDAERAALGGVAHLLPPAWRRVAEVVSAPVPPTPARTVPAPDELEATRLNAIEHIVVVMLENRSFDHILGYLSLPAGGGYNGKGRNSGQGAVDGLENIYKNINTCGGDTYPIHHLDRTAFANEAEDPDHSGASVDEQLANDGDGFVSNFKRISEAKAKALGLKKEEWPNADLVMGYYDGDDLPVYDHLAAEYCVVDRWYSSVPGATWPNRLYSIAGRAAGSRDDLSPPIYSLPSFARYLDACQVKWRWYSFDPATLRAVDPAYRLGNHHHFSYVDARKLSTLERAVGELTEEGPSFLDDVAAGELPQVSWIDPRFKDLKVLGPDSNDDHPPSDVRAGQELVFEIYRALSAAETWKKTLLIITYDEHGGFYDHVPPPAAVDEDPQFQRLGVRVPALLVSPFVAKGRSSTSLLGDDVHFDHTSIIKTILTRFCKDANGQIPALSARVAAANHLGYLLSDAPGRLEVPNHNAIADQMVRQRTAVAAAGLGKPALGVAPPGVARAPGRLTDFQSGFYEMARLLRAAGLPGGHP